MYVHACVCVHACMCVHMLHACKYKHSMFGVYLSCVAYVNEYEIFEASQF